MIGSFAFFFGIDTFGRTGFSNSVIGFFKAQPYHINGWYIYAMMVGWIILALAGSAVQSNYGSGGRGRLLIIILTCPLNRLSRFYLTAEMTIRNVPVLSIQK